MPRWPAGHSGLVDSWAKRASRFHLNYEEGKFMNAKNSDEGKKRRGFAAMDPSKQRDLASQGGRASHASGNAHQFTSEEARRAGRRRHELRQQQKGERQNG
jgi:uncharacterized protein